MGASVFGGSVVDVSGDAKAAAGRAGVEAVGAENRRPRLGRALIESVGAHRRRAGPSNPGFVLFKPRIRLSLSPPTRLFTARRRRPPRPPRGSFVSPSASAAALPSTPEYFDSDARFSSMDSDSSSQTMTVSVMGACSGRGATGWGWGAGATPGGALIRHHPGIIPGGGIIPWHPRHHP